MILTEKRRRLKITNRTAPQRTAPVCAVEGKANQVDDGVRLQLPNLRAERPRRLGRCPVNRVLLDRRPRAVRLVGFALAAADHDHFVATNRGTR